MRFEVLRLHMRVKYYRRDDGKVRAFFPVHKETHSLIVTVCTIALYERRHGSESSER